MLNFMMNACAVSYGYTSLEDDLFCSPRLQLCASCGINMPTSATHWNTSRGPRQLPDIIASNTPPSSPLRRTQSHYYVFPDKYHDHPEVRPEPVPEEEVGSQEQVSPSPVVAVPAKDGPGEEGQVQRGLERIQDVQRRILTIPGEMVDRSRHPLCWQVPKSKKNSTRTLTGPLCRACAPETEEARSWRHIGTDLRMVADQFQMTHSRTRAKWDGLPFNLAVPVVLSRCVSASLMFLLWWRLYNRFR